MAWSTRTTWIAAAVLTLFAATAGRAQETGPGPGMDPMGPLFSNRKLDLSLWAPGGAIGEPAGSGTYGVNSLFEMQRLFDIPPGEDEISLKRLGEKALLALPLARGGNGLQLLMRPQGDILSTYAKRFAIRRLDELSHITVPAGSVAVDLHVHTCYSHDSLADPAQMLRSAAHRGLSGLAITDHDTMAGAWKTQEIAARWVKEGRLPASFFVIAGEEITSADGHVIGLFLTSGVPAGLSAAETIRRIHEEGGLAIAAHPELSDGLKSLALSLPFDAVETQNAAEEMQYASRKREAVRQRAAFYALVKKPRLGVSDAHDPAAVAVSYTLIDDCAPTPDAVRAAILAGRSNAVERMPDEDERRQIRKGIPRVAFALSSLFGSDQSGLSLWLRRTTRGDTARLSLLPHPSFLWSKRF